VKTILFALVLLLGTACSSGGGHQHGAGGGGGGEHMSTEAFGEPGDPGDADQTFEVSTMDSLKFSPDALEAEAGDTITFEVTNEGSTDHEFVLGDEAYQEAHGPAMEGMTHEGNGVLLEPGDTATVTWTFAEAGEVLYACHINGHYEAGMVGRITVQ
jgi:uncharacterized cupredoxin-like copper-binding protein